MDPLQLYQQLLTLLQDRFAFTITNTLQNATVNDVMTVLNLGDKGLQYMEHLTLDQNVKNTIEAKNEAMQQAIQAPSLCIIELSYTNNQHSPETHV